ncbi:MAG: SLC13 family permease [Acidobacteriota bacterium]
MRELIACSSVALTLGLAIGRPRVSERWRIGPATAALAGLGCLLLSGIVRPDDFASAFALLWRPFVTILSIMVATAAARRVGVIDTLATWVFARRDLSLRRLYRRVFVLSAVVAAMLNNDAAVLLLTPLILSQVRRRHPERSDLLLPFACAVFMAAGVAPLMVSNPINMIVASYAGLNFNAYAVVMLPIAVAGGLLAFVLLRWLFRAELMRESSPRAPSVGAPGGFEPCLPVFAGRGTQVLMLGVLLATLGSYPVVATLNGSATWAVAATGAALALAIGCHHERSTPHEVLTRGVSWSVLAFLPAVFMLAMGLRNVGLVGRLGSIYEGASLWTIGSLAALGSAVLNNHPMAMMNMLALDGLSTAGPREYLAVLIGGDLGPRLLPMGSLAGLLWLDSCRRLGLDITVAEFVTVGAVLTLPTGAVSLLLLSLM